MTANQNRSDPESFEAGDTLEIPTQFLKALAADSLANDAFDRLATADQREFIDWVVEIKDADERFRRAWSAIDKLKAGKRPGD